MKLKYLLMCIILLPSIFCHAQTFNTFELNTSITSGKPAFKKSDDFFKNTSFIDEFNFNVGINAEALVFMNIGEKTQIGAGININQINYTHTVSNIITEIDIKYLELNNRHF